MTIAPRETIFKQLPIFLVLTYLGYLFIDDKIATDDVTWFLHFLWGFDKLLDHGRDCFN